MATQKEDLVQAAAEPAAAGSSRREARRAHLSCLAGLLVLCGLAVVGYRYINRPAHHFQKGLEALTRYDAATLQRAARALEGVKGYEPHAHLLHGAVLSRTLSDLPPQDRLAAALDHFRQALDHPDTRVLAHVMAGECFYVLNRFDLAETALQQAVLLDPMQLGAHRALGQMYYNIGAMTRALPHLARVAELAPHDPLPMELMGVIEKDFAQYAAAIESFQEALRRGPSEQRRQIILFLLAEAQVKLRRYDEALATLQECRRPPPDFRSDDGSPLAADYLALEAECHFSQGRREEARRLVDRALGILPDHLPTLLLDANLALESRDADRAVQTLLRAVQAHPKDHNARFRLVQAYRQLGDAEKAQEHQQVAESILSLRKKFTELHEQAMNKPGDAELRYELGVLAQELDKLDMAHVWFAAALAIDPNHKKAQQALSRQQQRGP